MLNLLLSTSGESTTRNWWILNIGKRNFWIKYLCVNDGPTFCLFFKPCAPLKYLFSETYKRKEGKKWKCNWKCWSIKRFVTQVCDFCLPPGSEDASKMHGKNNSELWTLMMVSNHFIWDWMQHKIEKYNVPNVSKSCH